MFGIQEMQEFMIILLTMRRRIWDELRNVARARMERCKGLKIQCKIGYCIIGGLYIFSVLE